MRMRVEDRGGSGEICVEEVTGLIETVRDISSRELRTYAGHDAPEGVMSSSGMPSLVPGQASSETRCSLEIEHEVLSSCQGKLP